MDFSAADMLQRQKDSVARYYEDLQKQISVRLQDIAKELPYSAKTTLIFVDESKSKSDIEQANFFTISTTIFNEEMFDKLADWLAGQKYMARKYWFNGQENHDGAIASISLSW